MRRAASAVLTLFLLTLPCVFLLPRLNAPVALSPSALDQLQAIRYSAANNRLGTLVIRPLETRVVATYGDGALPDLAHAPLYTGLAALSLKVLHETQVGQGQRALTLLGFLLFILSGAVTFSLFRRSFPERAGHQGVLFFVGSAGALLAILTPGPALLTALLGGLLCHALLPLDVRDSTSRAPWGQALLAGLLWGLLFLSLYSALLLLPFLLWHLLRVTRRDGRAVALFVIAAVLTATPQLLRASKFAHNPLYHSRWAELEMRTRSYPGEQLYHRLSPPRALVSYLPNGGLLEVAAKSGKTLTELVPAAVGTLGLSLLLFVASGLIRFTDSRLNRLRNAALLALPVHALALSLFFPAEECARALLLYTPLVCVLGSAFLETVVRARRLPRLYSRGILLAWTLTSSGLGLATLLGLPSAPKAARLYTFPGPTAAYLERVQTSGDGIFASDNAPALAFWTGIPTAYLPTSATDFLDTQERVGKPIVCFALTPALRWDRTEDAALEPWGEAYRKIIGLFVATESLRREERERFRREIAVTYPSVLFPAIKTFQAIPIREKDQGGDYSALFWDTRYTNAR